MEIKKIFFILLLAFTSGCEAEINNDFKSENNAEPPKGRSASYDPPIFREELKNKLKRANISFTTMNYHNREYIVWQEKDIEKVKKIEHRDFSDDTYGDAELSLALGETEKGIKLLQEASNAGDPRAQVSLGIELIRGKNIKKDNKKAVELYKLAAEKEDTSAYVNLGMAYYFGRGIEQDDVAALKWLRKAAEDKEVLGMWMMGKFYKEGRGGLEKDPAKASEWFDKAKALGADFSHLIK